jgi:hypothetical protein
MLIALLNSQNNRRALSRGKVKSIGFADTTMMVVLLIAVCCEHWDNKRLKITALPLLGKNSRLDCKTLKTIIYVRWI